MSLREAARIAGVKKGPEGRLVKALRLADPDTRADVIDCIEGAAEGEYTWVEAAARINEALGTDRETPLTPDMLSRWNAAGRRPAPWAEAT